MKIKSVVVGASCMVVAGLAQAQSSVTLYGAIDTSLRYTTNSKGANGPASEIQLTQGAIQGSRWGLRGSEDLGNGTKALFDLEGGFLVNNGTIDQQGQLFGRQAWVGLSNPTYGRLLAGRVYGIPFGLLSDFDPLGIGNYLENAYIPRILGTRFDDTLDYTITRGPLSLEVQRGVGGQAGSVVQGSTASLGLSYNQKGLEIGGVAQESRDANEKKMVIFGGGSHYTFGAATLYLMYFNARRDAGFTVSTAVGGALANTSLIGNSTTALGANTQTAQRIDSYMSFGLGYKITPTLVVTGGYFQDNVEHVVNGESGKIRTTLLNVDYLLSKQTDIYAEVDRNWLSGASVTDPNNPPLTFAGRSTRTGVGLGLRTRF